MIEINKSGVQCSVLTDRWEIKTLTKDQIVMHLVIGDSVSIYVDGWSSPWECFLDPMYALRVRCPTSPKVIPEIREVIPEIRESDR